MKNFDLLHEEQKRSFAFFWNEANQDKRSPGYGLILDKTGKGNERMASIASVGFGLSAIIIGIERNWITYEEGYERTRGTLHTFLHHAEHIGGFFYHFLDMETAKKYDESYDCASIIDSTIFLNGAVTAAEYFGGEIEELFEKIYARVDWELYYDDERNVYYMGYLEDSGGFGQWDMYAEQLMQYILGVSSPTHPVPPKIYQGFERRLGKYGEYEFYNAPGGALFTHQFSHAWFNFENFVDGDGINWFDNSKKASLASRQFSIDNAHKYKTFHENSWGLTACQGPEGYIVPGTPPFYEDVTMILDGTVPPCGAAGSIVFTPDESIAALEYYYEKHPKLWGKYGFMDAYNLEKDPAWYADLVIGIDKGISMIMIENYRTGLIWDLYMRNTYVQKAIPLLDWKKQT